MEKNYYKKIDLIRFFSCIGILLYHLGLLKGGYLAVCTFFVLTGYLSVISAANKKDFSIKKYYISRFKKLYLPLIIVVFLTILIISLIPSINYTNMKPETTSVLLGYNNYWQLSANLDYFVRHISSPFMHLWYISIILQYELVFPILYAGFKKFDRDINKIYPTIFYILIGIISFFFFYKGVKQGHLMDAYYGTFTRVFSLFFGVALGVIHTYFKPIKVDSNKLNNAFLTIYFIILSVLFFFIDFKSILFVPGMIIASIISLRLIDNSISPNKDKNILEKIICSLSKISYEIYLIQYPVIFIFQEIKLDNVLKIPLIIIITILLSYLIHFAIDISKKCNYKKTRITTLVILLLISIFGVYKYIIAKDYTEDIKKLQEELNQNDSLIKEKQKEYEQHKIDNEINWKEELAKLDEDENKVNEIVKNLRVVGIGDSIMELCVKELYEMFPNGYFDAATNRFEKHAAAILRDLKEKDMLGDVVVFNLGTNGNGQSTFRDEMLEIIGDRKVFWLNATRPDNSSYNDNLIEYANKHDNFYIIDWISYVDGHPEYLIYDNVHPSIKGRPIYAKAIYEGILKVFKEEYQINKEEKIKEHEIKEKQKVTFIGDDLLIGLYNSLKDDYIDSEFIIDKDAGFNKIKNTIKDKVKENSLNPNIVLAFNKDYLSNKEYKEIVKLLEDYNVYIIDLNNKIKIDNVNIISINYKDYLSVDGIHINDNGNKELKKQIDKQIKKQS